MSFPRWFLYPLAALALPGAVLGACGVRSGPNTAALVELYTSEGCSSCPPADEQLRRLHEALGADARFVPLSLHVGYWDYIGWKDPYAQPGFAQRQRWMTQAGGRHLVYTPQFFVNGAELRSWHSDLRGRVGAANEKPAAADIHVRSARRAGTLVLDVDAAARPGAEHALAAPSGALVVIAQDNGTGYAA